MYSSQSRSIIFALNDKNTIIFFQNTLYTFPLTRKDRRHIYNNVWEGLLILLNLGAVVRVSFVKLEGSRYADRCDRRSLLLFFSFSLSLPFYPFPRTFSIVIVCSWAHEGASVVYDVRTFTSKYTSSVEPSNQRISFYLMHFKYSDARFVVAGVARW